MKAIFEIFFANIRGKIASDEDPSRKRLQQSKPVKTSYDLLSTTMILHTYRAFITSLEHSSLARICRMVENYGYSIQQTKKGDPAFRFLPFALCSGTFPPVSQWSQSYKDRKTPTLHGKRGVRLLFARPSSTWKFQFSSLLTNDRAGYKRVTLTVAK